LLIALHQVGKPRRTGDPEELKRIDDKIDRCDERDRQQCKYQPDREAAPQGARRNGLLLVRA
jgi:hypothetical protein